MVVLCLFYGCSIVVLWKSPSLVHLQSAEPMENAISKPTQSRHGLWRWQSKGNFLCRHAVIETAVETAFATAVESSGDVSQAWQTAAAASEEAAAGTEALVPRMGRARVLGERSVGSPDPGAVSFAMAAKAAGVATD